MNKARRKEIDLVLNQIEAFKLTIEDSDYELTLTESQRERLTSFADEVERLKDEEQEYLDNIPENMQSSDRYYAAEEAVSNLENAHDWLTEIDEDTTIERCIEILDDCVSYLTDATA